MTKKIKINYAGFVRAWDIHDNYFKNLLSRRYELELSADPDILFCTCYDYERFKYNCVKIYYTGENERPSFTENDFVMSFDFNNNPRHYRLPLYALYMYVAEVKRQKGKIFNEFSGLETITASLCRALTNDAARKIWRSKNKFCCFVNSNPEAEFRIATFKKLSKYKWVDSGGSVLNNIGYKIPDKIDFIRDYRFVFAMENASWEGYTTEKIVEPFFVNSIPLYWGNPLVNLDFNPKSFINFHEHNNVDEFIDKIAAVNENEELAIEMLMQPKFTGGKVNEYIREENVLAFLKNIFDNYESLKPVSRTIPGKIFNTKKILYNKRLSLMQQIRKNLKKVLMPMVRPFKKEIKLV